MALTEAQRERWRAFVASGAPFAAYRQHNAPDARAETAELVLAVADHLAACERVLGLFQKAVQLFDKHSEMMCAFTALGTVDHERLVALSHEAHEAEQEAYDALAEWMEGDDGE